MNEAQRMNEALRMKKTEDPLGIVAMQVLMCEVHAQRAAERASALFAEAEQQMEEAEQQMEAAHTEADSQLIQWESR